MSNNQQTFWNSNTFKAIAGSSGGIFGFATGAFLGSVLIPIPVVGTTVGTILGGALGGTVGGVSGIGVAYVAGAKISPKTVEKEVEVKKTEEQVIDVKKTESLKKITEEELKKRTQYHQDMWLCVDGFVYDVTNFIKEWKSKNGEDDDCPLEEFAGKTDGSEALDKLSELDVLEIKKNLIGVLE